MLSHLDKADQLQSMPLSMHMQRAFFKVLESLGSNHLSYVFARTLGSNPYAQTLWENNGSSSPNPQSLTKSSEISWCMRVAI